MMIRNPSFDTTSPTVRGLGDATNVVAARGPGTAQRPPHARAHPAAPGLPRGPRSSGATKRAFAGAPALTRLLLAACLVALAAPAAKAGGWPGDLAAPGGVVARDRGAPVILAQAGGEEAVCAGLRQLRDQVASGAAPVAAGASREAILNDVERRLRAYGCTAAASSATSRPAASTGDAPLGPLARGEVRDLQQALNAAGYDAGPADGLAGPRTRSAVARFLGDRGLDPATTSLREALVLLSEAPAASSRGDAAPVAPTRDWRTSYAPADGDWEAEFARRERQAERLRQESQRHSQYFLGTMWNEVDAAFHRCAILLHLLGKPHLEALIEQPPTGRGADRGDELRIEANSLTNSVTVGRALLAMSRDEQINVWNLDCAGALGIPRAERIRPGDREAFFTVEGDRIRILGDVTDGFADRLKAAVSANPQVKEIGLGSAGGNVSEALQAGRFLRARQIETVLYNRCSSACSLVFIGGIQRQIWSPYPRLGFHKLATSDGSAVPDDHPAYLSVFDYAEEMGVDAGWLVRTMQSAAPSSMAYPEMADLCTANVATWVQRKCFGESFIRFPDRPWR